MIIKQGNVEDHLLYAVNVFKDDSDKKKKIDELIAWP